MLSDRLEAYETGAGSVGLPWLCVFASVTGTGGAAAFAGAIKTCKILIEYPILCSLRRSCPELARTSWHCYGFPPSGIWPQCIFLLVAIFSGV